MSLLVDPEYFLHNLKLNYLRRLPDPIGPASISFPSDPHPPLPSSSDQPPEQGPSTPRQVRQPQLLLTNPYIHLAGLSDSQRWPELLVRGSPPEPFSVPFNTNSSDQTPIRTRRRRADGTQPPHPSGTALRYSETIVGPKGAGLGAGMRVSGRKSIRTSRRPSPLVSAPPQPTTSTPPAGLPAQQDSIANQQNVHAGAHALALTEGRASLIPGGGLNPEDSDEDPNNLSHPSHHSTQEEPSDRKTTISRNPTGTTIRTHRRRVSAVTFANNALSFASPPGSILNLSLSRNRTRAQRGQSISSIATTNTVVSSDFSETANPILSSPTPSQLPHHGESTTESHPKSVDPSDSVDQLTSPLIPPRLESKTNADIYYSTEQDPDKRMSDLLFIRRPYDARRSTQIVGRVELEPAPLLEADNEDETGDEDIETDQTDTGTELGEDDSSFNPDENEEDSGLLDDSLSVKSRKDRLKREAGSIGTSSIDLPPTEDTSSYVGKILSNTLVNSALESKALDQTNDHSIDPLTSIPGAERPGQSSQSPPIVRRRERRRVNIKMGQLVGPPIIEEDSLGPVIDFQSRTPNVALPTSGKASRFPRAISSVSRPSLPDLRQALKNPNCIDVNDSSPHEGTPPSILQNSFSPGRARALTTPTPIPHISHGSNDSTNTTFKNPSVKPIGTSTRAGLRPISSSRFGPPSLSGPRLRRSLLQTAQSQSDAHSNDEVTTIPNNLSKVTGGNDGRTSTHISKASSKTKRPQLSFQKVDLQELKLKRPVVQKSILTQLLNAQSSSSAVDNPFRCFYALLASKERNALKITIYYPFSQEPRKPIKTSMKSDVCVEEVVGFALWSYMEEMREPKLDEIKFKPESLDLHQSYAWCLRLVEDDGEVDEDFPALERTRPAAKVGSNEFAVVMATEAQAQQNESAQAQIQRRPSRVLGDPKQKPRAPTEPAGSIHSIAANSLLPPITAVTGTSGTIYDGIKTIGGGISGSLLSSGYGSAPLGGSSLTGSSVYLKIRIPSPGRGVDSIITTMNVTVDMYLADVLETLVKKKSLGHAKDWALLVPSSLSIPSHQRDILVPLDRTVQSLQGVNSLALVKRTQVSSKLLRNTRLNGNLIAQNTNPSASIFKRLSEIPQPKYVSITDLTSSSKTFLIQTKRRGILGKSDRLLTIEDDYVHISPNHQSITNGSHNHNGHDHHSTDITLGGTSGKVSSYHISQIVDCIFRPQSGFKLIVLRDSGEKRYDVEAENAQSATEIVRHIKGLKEMYHSTRT